VDTGKDNPSRTSLWQLIASVIFLLVIQTPVFLLAGDWEWPEGWAFAAIFFWLSLGTLIYLYFRDPALLNERFSSPIQKEQRSFDKILLSLLIVDYIVWFVIMPLDARRYGWSPHFPIWAEATGGVLFALSFIVTFGAFTANTFAAPVVKLQKQRGQKVISTGLYGFVRHPMYLGGALLVFGGSILLGSLYGLLPAAIMTVILAVRSIGEEEMLKSNLDGYGEYMKKVRWRIVPFIF